MNSPVTTKQPTDTEESKTIGIPMLISSGANMNTDKPRGLSNSRPDAAVPSNTPPICAATKSPNTLNFPFLRMIKKRTSPTMPRRMIEIIAMRNSRGGAAVC